MILDGSYRVADKENRHWRNTYTDAQGQLIRNVHPPADCADRQYCALHRPSDHHMRLWPTNWRWDRCIMERLCPHGIGHPDPDDQDWLTSVGKIHEGVHGCDGCCLPPHESHSGEGCA